ncbi:MAG TPA: hypothetical protein VGD56_13580 [Gemmatirosa sp.]
MRVYLDTSHLALLCRESRPRGRRQRGVRAVEAFFTAWDAHGCELAVTETHLGEIAPTAGTRSAYAAGVLGVLRRFPRCVAGGSGVALVQCEARAQLLDATAVATARALGLPSAQIIAARDGPWRPLPGGDTVGQWRAHLDAAIRADRARTDRMAEGVNRLAAHVRAFKGQVPRPTRDALRREAARLGMAWLGCLDRADPADVGSLRAFCNMVAVAGIALPGTPAYPDVYAPYLSAIDPYGLPGTSCWFAVARERFRKGLEGRWYGSNDGGDVAHLVFAPYMDLFLADAETTDDFARETAQDVKRHASARPVLIARQLPTRVRRAGSVEAMTAEVIDTAAACRLDARARARVEPV